VRSIDNEASLLWQRSGDYARCAFAVNRDPDASGVQALFDHALNNGLAVIVSAAWPGAELETVRRRGNNVAPEARVKSASGLLDVLVDKAGVPAGSVTPSGAELAQDQVRVLRVERAPETDPEVVALTVSDLPEGHLPFRPLFPLGDDEDIDDTGDDVVQIEVATLRDAIRIAHPVRHGCARHGELERRHIDALLVLDRHPHLSGLSEARVDADYVRDKAQDLWLRDNAARYLALLDEDEIRRRVKVAADGYGPAPGGIDEDLQECPVCWNETLVPTSIDDIGIGIGVGTCIVCGYWRSPREADEAAQSVRWEHVGKHE
jgi:hypothetical protein